MQGINAEPLTFVDHNKSIFNTIYTISHMLFCYLGARNAQNTFKGSHRILFITLLPSYHHTFSDVSVTKPM